MADPHAEVVRHSPTQDLTGTRVGRFVIRSRLGAGGMGEVYRADDTTLKRPVALKCIAPELRADPHYRERFLKEAERASALNHQHVAGIYDVLEEKGELYLVMEYVEGVTLQERLRESLRLEQFLEIAIQSADGLVAAQEKGIMHGDIKPGNIMISSAGQVKILDFGVAKRLSHSEQSATTVTAATGGAGSPSGTPAYMAPEVLLGRESDGRADIFSLGVVFYEALTGRHPFLGPTFTATADRILHEAPPPVTQTNPRLPEELARIVGKMLAKDPAERYSTARDLQVDLRAVQRGAAYLILTPSPPARQLPALRWRDRRAYYVTAISLLVILALAGLWYWNRSRSVAFAQRDKVLVADFSNQTEEANLGATLKESLTYELEQSPYVHVFSQLQLQEALARMKLPPTTLISETVGREICAREGLQALLFGSVAKLDNRYVVRVRVVRPGAGELLASAQEVSSSRGGTLTAISLIARRLRQQLGETRGSIQASSPPLEQVTSDSFEAVQQFTLGRQRLYQEQPREALQFFLQALEHDPNFAMAHQYAAIAYEWLDDRQRTLEHLQRAVQLAHQLGPREHHKILGDYYSYLERYDRAISHYRFLSASYPADFTAYANLGVCFAHLRQYDAAITALEEALRLHPGPLVRPELAQQHFRAGRSETAVRLEKESLRENPERLLSWITLATYQLSRGELNEVQLALAEAEKRGALHGPDGPKLILARVDADLAQGRYREALRELELAPSALGTAPADLNAVRLGLRLAEIWLETSLRSKAAEELRRLSHPPEAPNLWLLKGVLSARAGQFALAESVLRLLEQNAAFRQSPPAEARVYQLRAEIAFGQGRFSEAVRWARAAAQTRNSTFVLETLARVQRAAGEKREAVDTYRAILARAGERTFELDGPAFYRVVFTHYELGRLLEEVGEGEAARIEYQEFLQRWQNADPELSALQDARRRLGQGAQSRPAGRVPTPAA